MRFGLFYFKVSVISRRLRLITFNKTLIILDITKTKSNHCFITHCFKENNDKRAVARNIFYYFPTKLEFTTCEIAIALGNHALRTHSTD